MYAYHEYLAVEQLGRLTAFEGEHPENNRLENRLAFFGQPYEIHISHSIMDSVAALAVPL